MNSTNQSVKVWDLPTRLFHWTLVVCFGVSWASAQLFDAMDVHLYAGYLTLVLVIFRVIWGFVGSSTARFSQFISGVRPTLVYTATLLKPRPSYYFGHNPLGGWAVILMLALLAFQAITGLFAHDDLLTSGPLAHHVSNDLSDYLSHLHHRAFNVLLAVVGLHTVAVLFYQLYKRNNLITTMLTGYKTLPNTLPIANLRFVSNRRAVLIATIVTAAVTALVVYS